MKTNKDRGIKRALDTYCTICVRVHFQTETLRNHIPEAIFVTKICAYNPVQFRSNSHPISYATPYIIPNPIPYLILRPIPSLIKFLIPQPISRTISYPTPLNPPSSTLSSPLPNPLSNPSSKFSYYPPSNPAYPIPCLNTHPTPVNISYNACPIHHLIPCTISHVIFHSIFYPIPCPISHPILHPISCPIPVI